MGTKPIGDKEMSKLNSELWKHVHKAGQLASELEEMMGMAEHVCREDSDIPQELWQEVEDAEAEAQNVNNVINELTERLAIYGGFAQ